jgi:putative sialic acid transporter
MIIVDDLRALSKPQRSAFSASLLGWTLDAFDFFILTLVVKDIATDFKAEVSLVSLGIALTLMMRPLGAFVFGWLADRFGRRPVLMADVLLFAGLEFASGLAPNLPTLLVLRLLFGFAMGGEWGIGASLALESIPAKSRGVVSGILQEGYAFGFLLAALLNLFVHQLGWRGMFFVGVAPALLVLYIRQNVPESPAFEAVRERARAARRNPTPPPELPAAARPAAVALQSLLAGCAFFAAPVWMIGAGEDSEVLLWAAVLAPAAVAALLLAYAYAGLRRVASPAVVSHCAFALRSVWLAVAASVLFALILFSISKPLKTLGVSLGAVVQGGGAVLGLWFFGRGVFGLRRGADGLGFRPIDPASFAGSLGSRWPLLLYVVVLMTGFNFFSHGTQDLYPTFLKVQHHFSPGLVSTLTIVGNLGAITGGVLFGALSQRIGRRRAIALAAVLALPILPLWAFSATPLMLGAGAFLMQISVQGAWGVVPVHLNELSPDAARGTFPGLAYQLGNLIASGNAVIQAGIAESRGDNYGMALAVVAGIVAVVLAGLAFFGPEKTGVAFGADAKA